MLAEIRIAKVSAITMEAVARISALMPALDSITTIQVMAELWPVLNTAALSTDMLLAKDIYTYAKTKIAQAEAATQVELDAYDPTTDIGWPT